MHFSAAYLLSCLVVAVAAYDDTTTSICDALASVLPNSTFSPETTTYNTSITSYPFAQSRLHPTCIVRPKIADDVATVVDLLQKSKGTKFAVKGGGHNANAGFNNVEDGVTIDMQSLNAVEHYGSVARVGAGALWQNVYDVVEKRNHSVLGGRIGVVGVAGFTTGGGISHFSPERGWSCDSVVNFEVVLANASIVNANTTSHPSLYAALKGGQNNFGIVTRFDFKTFPQGPIWGGRVGYAPEAETALATAFTDFKNNQSVNPDSYDPYAAGWVTFGYNGSANVFTPSAVLWYTKPELKPGALEGLTSVGPQVINGMATGTAGESARNASIAAKAFFVNRRTIWATCTFKINPTIVHRILALWKSLVPKLYTTYAYAKPVPELTFQSLPPPPRDSTPNSLGFSPDSTPEKDLVFLQVVFHHTEASATEGLTNSLKEFIELFDGIAEEEGVKSDWLYLNFAASFQDPLKAYGKESLMSLRKVARQYDPEGFFQKYTGGFKLFRGNETYEY